MKETVRKNLKTILCVVAIAALIFPICTVKTDYSEMSVNGFSALGKSIFAYLMILGPVLLAVMDRIKQLDGKRGIVSVAVPIVCFVSLIMALIACKSGAAAANGVASSFADIDVKCSLGFGSILLFADYIALFIFGAAQYHNEKFTRVKNAVQSITENGLAQLKNKPQQASPAADPTEQLQKLAQLKDSGIISEEEFAAKKAELLAKL